MRREARILFDRLVFEYAVRIWRGSGDSKMANDIKNWKERIKPIDTSQWKKFIESTCSGSDKGQTGTLRPVLYYYYILKGIKPLNTDDIFEVDHCFAKSNSSDNPMIDPQLTDSLANLALLPKMKNAAKGAKKLSEITDPQIQHQISHYTEIPWEELKNYTSPVHIKDIKEKRERFFIEAFIKCREEKLSN